MSSTCALLLLLSLSIAAAIELELPKIKGLKHQSQVLSADNPTNSPACFDYYRPNLEGISLTYEYRYNMCIDEYDKSASLDNEKWRDPRHNLVEMGGGACRMLTDCSTIVGYVEAFECFAQIGAEQSKSLYEVSASATETAVDIKRYYATIDTQKALCINNAERHYVEDTTSTYESLNACLTGKEVPMTPTTPAWDTTTPYPTDTTYPTD